jgi:uncharacterized protein (DUF885 family)
VGFSKTARYIYDLGVKRVDDNRKAIVATMKLLAPEYTTFEAISIATTNVSDPRWYFCGNDSTQAIAYVHTLLAKINDVILDEFGALSAIRPTVIEEDGGAYARGGEYDLVRSFWTKNAQYNIGRFQGCDKGNGPEAYFERLQLSTVLHEAFPGHGLQQSLANQVDCTFKALSDGGVPTGFSEGWALYVETLGYKMGNDTKHPKGLYTDPFDEFSYFLNTMLRNNRLQADSGLHGDLDGLPNWSVEQSIKALIDNGLNADYAKSETNRYINWPGQAVAYMLGAQIFLDLRAKTEKDLGKEFNAPEFHNIILKYGGGQPGPSGGHRGDELRTRRVQLQNPTTRCSASSWFEASSRRSTRWLGWAVASLPVGHTPAGQTTTTSPSMLEPAVSALLVLPGGGAGMYRRLRCTREMASTNVAHGTVVVCKRSRRCPEGTTGRS